MTDGPQIIEAELRDRLTACREEVTRVTAQRDAARAELASVREVIARYRDGDVSPVGAFGDIVRLLEGGGGPGTGEADALAELAAKWEAEARELLKPADDPEDPLGRPKQSALAAGAVSGVLRECARDLRARAGLEAS